MEMHTDRCSVGLGQSGVLQAPPWAAPAVLLRVLRSRVAVFRGLWGGSEGRKWLEDMTTVTTVLRE